MTFLVILIGLVIERFFDWSHLRNFQWFLKFENQTYQRIRANNPYLQLFLTIIPILMLVLLIQYLIAGWMYGMITLVFNICLLLYCFGPKNLWMSAFSDLTVMKNATVNEPSAAFVNRIGMNKFQDEFVNHIFIEGNSRIFAVIFWYFLCGASGALFYRLIAVTEKTHELSELTTAARNFKAILDWLPIRIFTFLCAVVGHFALVMSYWRKYAVSVPAQNELLLMECGAAALGKELDKPVARSAVQLLDRVLFLTLVMILVGKFLF